MKLVRNHLEEVKEAFALNWGGGGGGGGSDFEDAMQMTSAKNAEVDKLITLDKKFRNKDSEFIWDSLRFKILPSEFGNIKPTFPKSIFASSILKWINLGL